MFRVTVLLWHAHAQSHQQCPTLCNCMDRSTSVSSVRGILKAEILEWVAMPSSRVSSRPKDQTRVSYVSCIGRCVLYHQCHMFIVSNNRLKLASAKGRNLGRRFWLCPKLKALGLPSSCQSWQYIQEHCPPGLLTKLRYPLFIGALLRKQCRLN